MEISYESKWPEGITVTTVIHGTNADGFVADEMVSWPASKPGQGEVLSARTRPLNELELQLLSRLELRQREPA
jgi:hypothetical protein